MSSKRENSDTTDYTFLVRVVAGEGIARLKEKVRNLAWARNRSLVGRRGVGCGGEDNNYMLCGDIVQFKRFWFNFDNN